MMRQLCTLVLVASFALTGCFVESEPDPVVVTRGHGFLTVTWTLEGTDDPAACGFHGADTLDLFVERSSGGMAAHVSDFCEAFVTSVELAPGSYFADAILMDPGGHPITTAVDLGYFDIYGGDELVIDADFPPRSFY
jgi:hypothetical protein